jgi:transcriptional regulator with XRE-family HTH domain
MPKRTVSSLGTMVRKKRGARKLREVAKEIGIGPATLMRVEAGRVPDLATFGKICNWLEVNPGTFLGFDPGASTTDSSKTERHRPLLVSAHLRADQTPEPKTVNALAKMILLAVRHQRGTEEISDDGDV